MGQSLPITVLGANGWIGSALVAELKYQGQVVLPVDRALLPSWLAGSDQQGPVFYTIGLTADFREKPYETVEAHVSLLSRILQRPGINQLVYLSSTRVYGRSADTNEIAALPCLTSDPSDLYNLSKLLGESLVLQDSRPGFKVVRLSNVVGKSQPQSTFLGSLIAELRTHGEVVIQQSPYVSKNYVAIKDVVQLLPQILFNGQHRLYNLGSVQNAMHVDVAEWFERYGYTVRFASNIDSGLSFPCLNVERLAKEFVIPSNPFLQPPFNLL